MPKYGSQYSNRNIKSITDWAEGTPRRQCYQARFHLHANISIKVKAYQITFHLPLLREKDSLKITIRILQNFRSSRLSRTTSRTDRWTLKACPCKDRVNWLLEIKTQKIFWRPALVRISRQVPDDRVFENHLSRRRSKRNKVTCQTTWWCSINNFKIFKIPRYCEDKKNTQIIHLITWQFRNRQIGFNIIS